MTRLSVTLDDNTTQELEELPAWLPHVRGQMSEDDFARFCSERPRVFLEVVRSLRDLGDEPSTSAVIRQAVKWYLTVARDLERTALLEAGYSALAGDEERSAVLRTLTAAAAERWADEQ